MIGIFTVSFKHVYPRASFEQINKEYELFFILTIDENVTMIAEIRNTVLTYDLIKKYSCFLWLRHDFYHVVQYRIFPPKHYPLQITNNNKQHQEPKCPVAAYH